MGLIFLAQWTFNFLVLFRVSDLEAHSVHLFLISGGNFDHETRNYPVTPLCPCCPLPLVTDKQFVGRVKAVQIPCSQQNLLPYWAHAGVSCVTASRPWRLWAQPLLSPHHTARLQASSAAEPRDCLVPGRTQGLPLPAVHGLSLCVITPLLRMSQNQPVDRPLPFFKCLISGTTRCCRLSCTYPAPALELAISPHSPGPL